MGNVRRVAEADELISIGEAAAILGLSVTTLRRWDEAGIGPRPIRSSTGQRRYRRSDVLKEREGRSDGDGVDS